MKKISMKPLTEASWMLTADGDRVGLISQIGDRFVVIGSMAAGEHSSMDALKTALGGTIAIEQPADPIQDKEAGLINGYPIKHPEWHNVKVEKIPSYTRTARSENRYAAGYYGLKFPHGWTQGFCPKLSTLMDYEYIGPFTTKLEMQHQISSKNKTVNV